MNKIENKKFKTINLVDKDGKQLKLVVELPDDPKPQLIEYPSFGKEFLLIACTSFIFIIGLIIFNI